MVVEKIALVGSAPSSVLMAPYGDPTWEIWGTSPGTFGSIKALPGGRISRWFELHPYTPGTNSFTPEFCDGMAKLECPVYMIEHVPAIPTSVPYPKDEMIRNFGPYFFTSSLSWMFALALSIRGVKEIGLWGVDMSHDSEYALQRPGCWFFITEACRRGIKVVTPPTSDLLWPPPMYGFDEADPRKIKLNTRRAEIQKQYDASEVKYQEAYKERYYLSGSLAAFEYFDRNFAPSVQYPIPSCFPSVSDVGNRDESGGD